MDPLQSFAAVAVVSLLAAISPGPDFFIVLRNSLSYSRKAGLLTALGVSIALTFHLAYTLVGIGFLIAESPFVYACLKYVGVAYLFYLGGSSLAASFKTPSVNLEHLRESDQISPLKAFSQGFLTNLLNPKAALFFISLFSQFIDGNTPVFQRFEYALINWSVTLSWFLFLAYMVTMEGFITHIHRYRHYVDRVMGGALILLGLKLILV